MQLYSSALTHYPRAPRKVTVTLQGGSEPLDGTGPNPGEAEQADFPHPASTSTTKADLVREGAPSANMPADHQFSCYEPSALGPLYFTSTAEISIRRPGGEERSVPLQIVRESKSQAASSGPRDAETFLCHDSDLRDLMDHLRIGPEEVLLGDRLLHSPASCRSRTEETGESGADAEMDVHSRRGEWTPINGEAPLPSRPTQPVAPAPAERQDIELRVLQEAPPQRRPERENANDKVTRYLAEVEKQNQYLQERHKYRYHIIPDGNCLYRAVCKATYGDQARHGELREETVHHIADHLDQFNPILEGDMLNTTIYLTTGGSLESPTVSTMGHYLGQDDPSRPAIWLSWLSNGHYDVLLDKSLPNPEYEDWCRHSQMQKRRDEELAKSMAASLSKMYIEQN
ncbi:unnamed protein product, partial [Tetraodon nigroviridis]